jgi:hypothetical protein
MANLITTSKAPALALTPTQFSQVHFDLFNNQLRVYFNTLDAANVQTQQAITTLSTPSAGTTALRPSTGLLVGQFYFDTSLGIPIWWNGTNWVDATGTVV